MRLCVDCIHVGVCYRQGTVDLNYADKCGDYEVIHKGHWITEGIHWKPIFKCSECGSVIEEMPTVMDKPKYKGCPYCLAEMESDI